MMEITHTIYFYKKIVVKFFGILTKLPKYYAIGIVQECIHDNLPPYKIHKTQGKQHSKNSNKKDKIYFQQGEFLILSIVVCKSIN
jgi:hypothetical protein